MWQAVQKDDGTWTIVDGSGGVITGGLTHEQATAIVNSHNRERFASLLTGR